MSTDGLPRPRRYWAAAAIWLAIAMSVLDGAVANVALPTIAAKLETTPAASTIIGTAPRERSGAAGGILATAKLLGQTVGAVAVAVSLLRLRTPQPSLDRQSETVDHAL